ncbi:MAG: hypothetical protein JST04_15800 [Bdellovibrionales bacterium]|nr:hypothetical protein [Bdellovibrionales bacterium]
MKKSLIKNSLMGLAGLAMMAGLSACNGGGGGGGGVIIIDPVVYAWFDVYGNGCATAAQGPGPGCNYYAWGSDLVKIMDFEDPYFNDYYWPEYNTWDYYLNGVLYEYTGWGWVSPTGILYDDYGNALNKKKGSGGRDMVRDVAKAESKIVEKAGKDLAAKYNLSVSKGVQIARTLNDWAKIGKQRAKTEKDFAEFSQKLYGVDYTRVKKAVLSAMNGDKADMKATVADAAKNWGTNEETMKQVLKNWYHDQVPGLE